MHLSRRAPLAAVALLVGAGALMGCETFTSQTCDLTAAGNPAVVYRGGTTLPTTNDAPVYVYTSSPDSGELLYFPGGMHYALVTSLPCAPHSIEPRLSFDRYGTDGGDLTLGAGNEAVFLGFDQQTKAILIANDSCVEFWLQVKASVVTAACP